MNQVSWIAEEYNMTIDQYGTVQIPKPCRTLVRQGGFLTRSFNGLLLAVGRCCGVLLRRHLCLTNVKGEITMRILSYGAAYLVAFCLLGGVPVAAQTAQPAPANLNRTLSEAEKLKSADLDRLLDEQLDKAAAKDKTGGEGDGVQETHAAQQTAQRAAKSLATGRRVKPLVALIGLMLGSALVLFLLSASVVRLVARRLARSFAHDSPARPHTASGGMRYSWHYRDAVEHLPAPPRTRRR